MYMLSLQLPSWQAQKRPIFIQALGSLSEAVLMALLLAKAPPQVSSSEQSTQLLGGQTVPSFPEVQISRLHGSILSDYLEPVCSHLL